MFSSCEYRGECWKLSFPESSGTASTRTQAASTAPGQWVRTDSRFSEVLERFFEHGEHRLRNAHVSIEIPFAVYANSAAAS